MNTPKIIVSPDEMREYSLLARKKGLVVGFVPTLGNLHDGHAKLMCALRSQCDILITSIFVNPTQFAEHEDLDTYPRSEKEDLQLCATEKNDVVFMPQAEDIYIGGHKPLTLIDISTMTQLHCGVTRPHFFPAVLTIVNLLFNMVFPHKSAFGKKDFQQLRLVQTMVKELHIPVEILSVDTGRAEDGLALSSRNRYLTNKERSLAPYFYATLCELRQLAQEGWTDYRTLEQEGLRRCAARGLSPEYVHICRYEDLQPANLKDSPAQILAAVTLGKARLIDNIALDFNHTQ